MEAQIEEYPQIDSMLEASQTEPQGDPEPPPEIEPHVPQPVICIDLECKALHPDGTLDEEREAEIVQNCVDMYLTYKNDQRRQDIESWWKWCWAAYWGYKRTNSRTEYVIRECFKQMEVWKANVFELLMGGDEFFNCKARIEEGAEAAEGAKHVIHDQLRRFKSVDQIRMWIESMGMFGCGYIHPHWRMFAQTRMKMDWACAEDEDDAYDREDHEVKQNSPFAEFYSPEDVYCDPGVPDCRNSPGLFVVKMLSPADIITLYRERLIDRQRTMEALNEISGRFPSGVESFRELWDDEEDMNSMLSDTTAYKFMLCQMFDGWEYIILNEKYLLRAMKLPDGKIEFIGLTNYPQAKMHYGVPELMLIVEDQRMMNELANIYMGSHFFTSNPMFKVQAEAAKYFDKSDFHAGGRVIVDKMDDVEVLAVPQTTMLLEGALNFIRNNMQLTTGLTSEVAGTGSEQKTATGLVRIQDAAQKRIQYKVVIARPAFEDLYRAFYNLNARYLQGPDNGKYKMRITGSDGKDAFKDYPPTIFGYGPDVDIDMEIGTGTGPEQVRLWIEVIKLSAGNPIVNQQPLWDNLFRSMGQRNVRIFRASSQNAQAEALGQIQQLLATGLMPEAKPAQDHMTFVNMFTMALNMPMPDGSKVMLQGRLAEHMSYVQQMMQANAQMQQQPMGGPQQPLLPGPQEANQRTEGTFNNADTGAMQNAPMPQ